MLIFLCMLNIQLVYAQTPQQMPDYLRARFMQYVSQVPREELFVQTDREEYLAGEVLWFNMYLVDRQTLKPSSHSSIAYFELLSEAYSPVLQKRVLLAEGCGPGQLVLPDTLSSGRYIIRAYTSWMKNFMPENCFIKEVMVYNRVGHGTITTRSHAGRIIQKSAGAAIKGKGPITMDINNSKPELLEIMVNAEGSYLNENDGLFYLFVQTRGNINHVSAEKLNGDSTTIRVPKSLLGAGIHQITLFNTKGEPVGERYVFTPGAAGSVFTLQVADTFEHRERITIAILPDDVDSGSPGRSHLSISVAPFTGNGEVAGLRDYLVFGTEYGLLPGKSLSDLTGRGMPSEVMDSIMYSLQSNWINWESILSGDIPVFDYPVEKSEHFLFGKTASNDQQAVRSGEVMVMTTPGKEAMFQYTKTDEQGVFRFSLPVDTGLKDLIIMPGEEHINDKLMIGLSYASTELLHNMPDQLVNSQVPPRITKMSVNQQVQKIYGISVFGSAIEQGSPAPKPLRFYGKPDIELIMADYITLPVMEEVFYELLPDVSLKKRTSGYGVTISYRIDNELYVTSPCVMIDGVIIRDAALIADLDPQLVEKIDVIRGKYMVGRYTFPGIVNVITKTGDFSCVPLPPYMIRIPYRVTDQALSFDSPEYSTSELKNSRIPDYRNTLYWNAIVKPGSDGKTSVECWSSDNSSDYLITIEGITAKGQLISLRKVITVK